MGDRIEGSEGDKTGRPEEHSWNIATRKHVSALRTGE